MKTAFLVVAILLVAQLSQSQKVGIGNTNPGYILDVSGRMRLRHVDANNTSGVWFNKSNNTEGAFTGMINDTTIGIFGNGTVGNWRIGIDVKNAMLGIGNTDPTAPLSFNNNIGDKIDIFNYSATSRYGIGLQYGLMQLYSGSAADDIAFGYGSSAMFTENMRVKGNGNVGIGVTNPTLAGLQVNTKVGGVNAMFGSNTTGIAIETGFPGIGFNSYYNGSRKIINTGYGGLVGLDPSNGRFYIFSSPASVTGQGTSLNIMERLSILPNGNVGIGNAAPTAPLSFDNNVGNKIDIYNASPTSRYGIGLQSGLMQLYSGSAADDIAFGYGSSGAFTEKYRFGNNGYLNIKNGRIRFTGQFDPANPQGIEFTNLAGNALRGYIGQFDNNQMGFYGYSGAGWALLFNQTTGQLNLGATRNALDVSYKLNVGGKILAEEVRVQLQAAWPDYVFDSDYPLKPLEQVSAFIKANSHLPGIPAAADVASSGIALGDMQTKMMEKIEELTLYVIQLKGEIEILKTKNQ